MIAENIKSRRHVVIRVSSHQEQVVILHQLVIANTFWSRCKGLLGARQLAPGEGLLIYPCRSVHTLGMRYPIDVAFLNRAGVVLKTARSMPPVRWVCAKAACQVLEMRAGTLARWDIRVNDSLHVEALAHD